MITKIYTAEAPTPAGHYSQAIVHNGLVYVAGQLPINPHVADKTPGDIAQQTTQVLRNLEAVLKASGSSKDMVLKVTIYVSDISLWGEINKIYAAFFGDHRPARAVIPVKDLNYGYQLELEAIAAVA